MTMDGFHGKGNHIYKVYEREYQVCPPANSGIKIYGTFS